MNLQQNKRYHNTLLQCSTVVELPIRVHIFSPKPHQKPRFPNTYEGCSMFIVWHLRGW